MLNLITISVVTASIVVVPRLPPPDLSSLASSSFVHMWITMIFEDGGPLDNTFLQISTFAPTKAEALFISLTSSPLFEQMGFIARVMALLAEHAPFVISERLVHQLCSYSNELLIQWERSPWYYPNRQGSSEDISQTSKGTTGTSLKYLLWQYFKTFIFTTTATSRSCSKESVGRRLVGWIPLAKSCLICLQSCYLHVVTSHFITLEFGREGFETYQTLLRRIMESSFGDPLLTPPLINKLVANLYHSMPWIRNSAEENSHLQASQGRDMLGVIHAVVVSYSTWTG